MLHPIVGDQIWCLAVAMVVMAQVGRGDGGGGGGGEELGGGG